MRKALNREARQRALYSWLKTNNADGFRKHFRSAEEYWLSCGKVWK